MELKSELQHKNLTSSIKKSIWLIPLVVGLVIVAAMLFLNSRASQNNDHAYLAQTLSLPIVEDNDSIPPIPHIKPPMAMPDATTIPSITIAPHFSPHTWYTLNITHTLSLAQALKRFDISSTDIKHLLTERRITKLLPHLLTNQQVQLQTDGHSHLTALHITMPGNKILVVTSNGKHFIAKWQPIPLEARTHFAYAKINNCLVCAANSAHIPVHYIYEVAKIFAWDIDFTRDIHAGDHFVIMYQDFYQNNHKVKDGPIIAAEFFAENNTHTAIRFSDASGNVDYYDAKGNSLRKAFLRAPIQYTHISSTFNNRRYHPILHFTRPHLGIDYAGPIGTPIHATGNGYVSYIGHWGGYGNVIMINHNAKYRTLYAHMYHFASHLRRGARVKQGQIIGYVGESGLATGPHVHYEFRIFNHPVNPANVKLVYSVPISAHSRAQFRASARKYAAQLEQFSRHPNQKVDKTGA